MRGKMGLFGFALMMVVFAGCGEEAPMKKESGKKPEVKTSRSGKETKIEVAKATASMRVGGVTNTASKKKIAVCVTPRLPRLFRTRMIGVNCTIGQNRNVLFVIQNYRNFSPWSIKQSLARPHQNPMAKNPRPNKWY